MVKSCPSAQPQNAPVQTYNPDRLRAIAFPEDNTSEQAADVGPYLEPHDAGGGLSPEICDGIGGSLDDESDWFAPCYEDPRPPLGFRLCDRLWGRGEYLLWWTEGSHLPALVTSSPAGTAPELSGVLGEPGTVTLFGNSSVTNDMRSGGRFALGYWLLPCRCTGIEADYLFLGTEATRYRADSSAVPILARPYLDLTTGAEAAFLVAHPDFLAGSVAVDATNRFQSAGALFRQAIVRHPWDRLDVVAGYRFARLDDGLAIHQFSEWTHAQGVIPTGTTKDITDSFDTINQFHGAQLGAVYQEQVGRWSLEMQVKLGLGNTHSRVQINGSTTTTALGGEASTIVGGLLAQTTNIGTKTQDDFSILPELGVTLGYDLAPQLRATFGYTLVYWSRVVRPGDIVDLDLSQLPPEPPTGAETPQFTWRTTDFWAQGMTFGLTYTF